MNCFFLKLNAAKSQIIVFPLISLNGTFINSSCVKFCNIVKNLGLLLDQKLTFEPQINKCCVLGKDILLCSWERHFTALSPAWWS